MPDDLLRSQLQPSIADRYAIEREVGRGGMATVYLARDLKHQRVVAIKVLNPDLGAVLGAERFLSEIRVTANLQHPNLLPLFDSGEASGLLYYVMPFVEGESLRARLDREKQLPVDEAVHIATAVANALDYAHGHGVIHRDLKPENILLQFGQPVVADFGIALAVSNAGGTRVTQTGLSLGTPQYMSPEQATGDRVIDRRADIYSLGAVTYEMLTGEPPHTASTAQAIIARLMTEAPRSVRASRPSVPEHVDAAVHRALEKLPADRFGTAKEFADALEGRTPVILSREATKGSHPRTGMRSLATLGMTAAVGMTAVAVVLASIFGIAWWRASHRPAMPTMRFTIEPPDSVQIDNQLPGRPIAISNDGQMVAFANALKHQLYLRRLDRLQATPYPRAARVSDLHFSADGKWLLYMNGGIYKIPTDAGDESAEPTKLATVPSWNGLTAEAGRDVVWASRDSLFRSAVAGGTPKFIASMDSTEGHWQQPYTLPDSKTIALRVTPRAGTFGGSGDRLGLVSVDGGKHSVIDMEFQSVIGYADGILVYGTATGRVMAVELDLRRRIISGESVAVLDGVAFKPAGGSAAQMSENGALVYLTGGSGLIEEIVDAKGKVVSTLPETQPYSGPSFSPDGSRIAVAIGEAGNSDIWVYDMRTRVMSRIADHGRAPAWTPDGKRIAFVSTLLGRAANAVWIASDGSSAAEPIPGGNGLETRQIDFTSDGRYAVLTLLAISRDQTSGARAVALPVAGGQRIPLIPDVVNPGSITASPNGKWMAYSSSETGRSEVYVRPFPSGAGKLQISAEGGQEAKWTRDGKRIIYRSNGAMVAVTLDIAGAMPRVVRSDTLFADAWAATPGAFTHDMNADGTRFVLGRSVGNIKLVVVTNFMQEVKAKIQGGSR